MNSYFRLALHMRAITTVVVTTIVAAMFVIVGHSPAYAEDNQAAPIVGSFGIGGGIMGDIDERTGQFDTQVALLRLGGIKGNDVELGLSYRGELANSGNNRFGLGQVWGWNIPFMDLDGGVRFFAPSGGSYEADASQPSGLRGYSLRDLVFRQKAGILPAIKEVPNSEVAYEFSCEHTGGVTDYFNATGDLVARVNAFSARTVWTWGDAHRLLSVMNDVGSQATIEWTDTGVNIIAPPRSDGAVPHTVLNVTENRVSSVTNPLDETLNFGYDDSGFVDNIRSSTGAITDISYQKLANQVHAVDRVRVTDTAGTQLSVREWKPNGDHLFSGWPTYAGENALGTSGDSEYHYRTELFDGASQVVSEYNSMGLLISREVNIETSAGPVMAQEQRLSFPGTEDNGVPDPQALPPQYQRPTHTTVIFHDARGGTRQVSEETTFDEIGRLIRHVNADGSVTETVYDTDIPEGMNLPVGIVRKQTTTGTDGLITQTVNTLTADHKSIQATETRVGPSIDAMESTSRIERIVDSDGFVNEEKTVSTDTTTHNAQKVITRFDRTIDTHAGVVRLSQTDAVETGAEATTVSVNDITTGLELSTTDTTGRVASFSYDLAERVASSTDYEGRVTTTQYEPGVTRVTDPRKITESTYVDVLGRVVKITDNISGVDGVFAPKKGYERTIEMRSYEQNASRITVTDGRGRKTVTISDAFGRPISVTGPRNLTTLTEYDDVNNTVRSGVVVRGKNLQNALQVSTTRMDNSNREIERKETYNDKTLARHTSQTYDGLGRITGQTSADTTTRMTLNPNGTEKTKTVTPEKPDAFPGEQVTVQRDRDFRGMSTQKTISRSSETKEGMRRVVDAAGRTVSETDQTGGITTYEYTVDGLVTQSHNEATGVVTRNTYDAASRALTHTETVDTNGVETRTAFEYDPETDEKVAIFDPDNRGDTEIRYTYNIFGNLTSMTYPDGKTIRHTYDEFGTETTRTDVAGNVTRYEYDDTGLMVNATQTTPDGELLSRVEYEYDSYGRTQKLSRNNGVVTEYTFTASNQIHTETTKNATDTLYTASYVYDGHGNLTQRTQTQSPEGIPVTETTVYSYNAYNQLIASNIYAENATEEPHAGEPTERTEYDIGVTGNVTQETLFHNGSVTTTRQFETNPLGQTTAITTNGVRTEQLYDRAGNLTHAADGTQYTYNSENQPVTETRADGTRVENTYWATGQYNTATTNNQTGTQTVAKYWDGTALVNDIQSSSTSASAPVIASYLIGLSRHSRALTTSDTGDGTTTKKTPPLGVDYYLTDRHGNTVATTNNTGTVTNTYTYTDYGTPTVHTAVAKEKPDETGPGEKNGPAQRNPFMYAGEYTTETGIQLLGSRTYIPEMKAFTTHDIADQFNAYAYANSNPITLVDPSGQTAGADSITTGLYTGMGIIMALIGIGLTLPLSVGWGIFHFGMAAADAGIVITQAVQEHTNMGLLDDKTSAILTYVSLGLGGASMLAGSWIKGEQKGVAAIAEQRLKNVHTVTEPDRFDAMNIGALDHYKTRERELDSAILRKEAKEAVKMADAEYTRFEKRDPKGDIINPERPLPRYAHPAIVRAQAFERTAKQYLAFAAFLEGKGNPSVNLADALASAATKLGEHSERPVAQLTAVRLAAFKRAAAAAQIHDVAGVGGTMLTIYSVGLALNATGIVDLSVDDSKW